MPRPSPKKISQIKPIVSRLALTSHYAVEFGGLHPRLRRHLSDRGIDARYITESIGLLCSKASLPGSGFATADIVGNFQGVTERMAHTRTFTQMSLEFYVDTSYRSLKFLEHWMEFMSSGSSTGEDGVNPLRDGYYFRMRYPNEYKCDETRIVKFEKDYNRYIEYRFFGLFPIALDSVSVSYDGSSLLKATATFNYDRYVSGQSRSIDEFFRTDNNKDSTSASSSQSNKQSNSIYGAGNLSFEAASKLDLGITLPSSTFPNYSNYFKAGSSLLNDSIINTAFIGERRAG